MIGGPLVKSLRMRNWISADEVLTVTLDEGFDEADLRREVRVLFNLPQVTHFLSPGTKSIHQTRRTLR